MITNFYMKFLIPNSRRIYVMQGTILVNKYH